MVWFCKKEKKEKKKDNTFLLYLYCPLSLSCVVHTENPFTEELTFWFYLLSSCNTYTVVVFCIIYVFFAKKKIQKQTFLFTENILFIIHEIDVFICGICGF